MVESDVDCSLCGKISCQLILTHKDREFYQCARCDLVFVPALFHLSPQDEKVEYLRHQNHVNHTGYRDFLSLAISPLSKYLKQGMVGLDYGCGPGPVLNQMLSDLGFPTSIYDPFYANAPDLLNRQYDFVTCTEVVEHFSKPYAAWKKLVSLVQDDGYIAIMTLLRESTPDFATWWYKNDLTHVAFYSNQTIKWLAEEFNLRLLHQDSNRVFLLQAVNEFEQV